MDPRVRTLTKLLDACGVELETHPRIGNGVDRSTIRELLPLTPTQRMEAVTIAARNVARALPKAKRGKNKLEPFAIFRALQISGVDFVLVGGAAGAAHGSTLVINEVEICYSRDTGNRTKLIEVLRGFRARLRSRARAETFELSAGALGGHERLEFATVHGEFACLHRPPGSNGYQDLISGSEVMDLDGVPVAVASIEDLIRMKRGSSRPEDRYELEILGALRDEIDSTES